MSKRYPAVSGQFYPRDSSSLLAQVSLYIEQSNVSPSPNEVLAIVSPHAGYMYSGPTAGCAFARIREHKIKRAFLVGRSHRYLFDGLALCEYDSFITPVGEFPVDLPSYKDLGEHLPCVINNNPHLYEHCLEVMLPFLYVSVGIIPIVPILFGKEPEKEHYEYGKILASLAKDGDLVVASTDLSHYLPEVQANKIDNNTIQAVMDKDLDKIITGIRNESCSMCGAPAVIAAMGYASAFGDYEVRVLDYSTSAKASGDYSSVVGYMAISFELNNSNK